MTGSSIDESIEVAMSVSADKYGRMIEPHHLSQLQKMAYDPSESFDTFSISSGKYEKIFPTVTSGYEYSTFYEYSIIQAFDSFIL